jgi:hypothetical protein
MREALKLKPLCTSYLFSAALLGAVLALMALLPTVANAQGGPPEQVTICHRPGTPAQQTQTIPSTALEGHLGHGDTEGFCCPCEGLTLGGVTWGSEFTVRFCGPSVVSGDTGDFYIACDQQDPEGCPGQIGVYQLDPEAYINCHVGGTGPGGYQVLTIDAAQRDACVESIMRLAEEDGVECPPSPY